jgi:glyoxylase-like metal-dependent hydrolase (beta-lactamase superfamily II)
MSISRRAFLISATAASALLLPRPRHLLAQTVAQLMPRNAGFYRFKLGQFNLTSISDGKFMAPAAVFAGNAAPEELKAALKRSFQSENLALDCNVLFVDTGTEKVLIDTGSGSLNGPTVGKLLENLRAARIKPADITAIVLTHAHGDHIGGLKGTNGLTFPNARYFMGQKEWDFWMAKKVDLPNFKGPADMKKQAIEIAKTQLPLIKDRVTLVKENEEFLPGLTAIPAYGHTAGHIAVRIASGDAVMVHTADVVHSSAVNLFNPSWTPIFDADQVAAAKTRQALLSKIATDRTLVFAYHFPYPGIGNIRPLAQGGFDWQPREWQFDSASVS